MKKKTLMILLATAVFSTQVFAQEEGSTETTAEEVASTVESEVTAAAEAAAEDKSAIGVTASLAYRSDYYWRGQSFYGKDQGVFFPGVTLSYGNAWFYVGGEIGESLMGDNPAEFEKDWAGIDYMLGYYDSFMDGFISWNVGLSYFWYFQSTTDWNQPDKAQGASDPASGDFSGVKADNSFMDIYGGITLSKILLKPSLSVSYYHRMGKEMDPKYGKSATENEDAYSYAQSGDMYVTLGISHGFKLSDSASLTLSANINYFHYASAFTYYRDAADGSREKYYQGFDGKERDSAGGISDSKFTAALSVSAGKVTYNSSFNYAIVYDPAFATNGYVEYQNWGNTEEGPDMNKYWANFSVSYAIQ